MLFLGIISRKVASLFSGGEVVFRLGTSFLSGGCAPWGGWHWFWWGGVSKKIVGSGGAPHAPITPTMGNPAIKPGNGRTQQQDREKWQNSRTPCNSGEKIVDPGIPMEHQQNTPKQQQHTKWRTIIVFLKKYNSKINIF